ncbi:MAG: tryptophan synthase subunit alpha [Deferribacterota bacterium]|nr:tryptophan synthase subunit alpha [Deferribacterota bacterium]
MIGVYIVGGYPNIEDFKSLFRYLQNSKVDFIEVGLPFNDPVADGPIIAEAIYKTIEKGITVGDILEVISKEKKSKKTYIMTYSNIIFNLWIKVEDNIRIGHNVGFFRFFLFTYNL